MLKRYVYICVRINPSDNAGAIKLVTASFSRADAWLDSACAAEPTVTFFYTRRILEDL